MSAEAALASARRLDNIATTLLVIVTILALLGLAGGVAVEILDHYAYDRIVVGAEMLSSVLTWLVFAVGCTAARAFADYIRGDLGCVPLVYRRGARCDVGP